MNSKRISIILMAAFFACTSYNLFAQTPTQNEWWSLNGNSLSGQEFFGTTNPFPLRFYVNGAQCGIFSHSDGYFGVGVNNPQNPLHIHSNGTRSSYLGNTDILLGMDRDGMSDDSSPMRTPSAITSNHYSGLQITNAATGVSSGDGLLLYVHGNQGFLRHLEDEPFTIGVNETDIMNFTPQGYVGIGTDQPAQLLHVVDGNILISKTSNMNNRAPGSVNGSMLFGADIDNSTQHGRWGIEYVNSTNEGYGLNFWQPHGQNQSSANYRLFLADDGNIGIKTNHPQAELAVNGTVLAKAVRVNTDASYWPDYVFANDYRIMSLSELEGYVNEHKHLPGIPSASEVEEKGSVDLGEMNTLLLQKVEELTRYIIDLQKQIDELKNGKEE